MKIDFVPLKSIYQLLQTFSSRINRTALTPLYPTKALSIEVTATTGRD